VSVYLQLQRFYVRSFAVLVFMHVAVQYCGVRLFTACVSGLVSAYFQLWRSGVRLFAVFVLAHAAVQYFGVRLFAFVLQRFGVRLYLQLKRLGVRYNLLKGVATLLHGNLKSP
jgi:predicted lysophospholipase L1 biosynthesis ABC-type transport system permease subunit